MERILIMGIVFLASSTQSLSGFGSALVAVALLPGLLEVGITVPLIALLAFTLEFMLLLWYRHALEIRAILPVTVASVAGIPLGLLAFKAVDERVFLISLGVFLVSYGLYALLRLRLPELTHPRWAYLAGVLAGILGGAYGTSGPPVIIYGNCRRWPPAVFKANLQGFFLINTTFLIAGHAISHNLTALVWTNYWYSLPPLGLGVVAGIGLGQHLNPEYFRKMVLFLLVLMGVRLMFSAR